MGHKTVKKLQRHSVSHLIHLVSMKKYSILSMLILLNSLLIKC